MVCPCDVRAMSIDYTTSVRCPVVCPWYVRGMSLLRLTYDVLLIWPSILGLSRDILDIFTLPFFHVVSNSIQNISSAINRTRLQLQTSHTNKTQVLLTQHT